MDAYFKLTNYKPNNLLTSLACCINQLKIVKFVLKNLAIAVNEFYLKKNYHHFDAHVGDALCQIRALKLLELSMQKIPNFQVIIERSDILIDKIDLLINKLLFATVEEKRRFKPITLEAFFLNQNFSLEISEDTEFLIKCLLLTKYKKHFKVFDSRIDVAKLKKDTNMGEFAAKKFVRHLQTSVSTLSVDYIKSIPSNLNFFLKPLTVKDSIGRLILPFYLLTLLIFEKLKILNADILVLIRDQEHTNPNVLAFVFKYNPETNSYYFNGQLPAENHNYFVLHGNSAILSHIELQQYRQKIIALGVEKLLLYVSAIHPQYSPIALNKLNNNTYKNLADYAKKSNDIEIIERANKLLTKYENARLNYIAISQDSGCYFYQIEHITMGTLDSHRKMYAQLALGKLATQLEETLDNV